MYICLVNYILVLYYLYNYAQNIVGCTSTPLVLFIGNVWLLVPVGLYLRGVNRRLLWIHARSHTQMKWNFTRLMWMIKSLLRLTARTCDSMLCSSVSRFQFSDGFDKGSSNYPKASTQLRVPASNVLTCMVAGTLASGTLKWRSSRALEIMCINWSILGSSNLDNNKMDYYTWILKYFVMITPFLSKVISFIYIFRASIFVFRWPGFVSTSRKWGVAKGGHMML